MAVRAQTSIEFLLILSAVILVVLAGLMSLSEIMKMQQGAYSTAQGGVQNASSSLLTYLSNESFGTGFYPVSGGFGNYTNASLVSLELTKNEPYFVNQPAVVQLTAWNNYPDPMRIPKLLIWIVNSSGNETPLSPSEEDNVTVIASHTLTATFIPANAGVYNVSAVAQNESGDTLVNPNTSAPVLVMTNFTVLSYAPPSNGAVKTFNIDQEVVAQKGTDYTGTFSLPNDAVIYSAVLEITDAHSYESKSASAKASYKYSSISGCGWDSMGDYPPMQKGISSLDFLSQEGSVELPPDSVVTGASYYGNKLSGGQAMVDVNGVNYTGMQNSISTDVLKTGMNTIGLSIQPESKACPRVYADTSYNSDTAAGDVTLVIQYYAPASGTSKPADTVGSIVVKTENSTVQNLQASSVMDLSSYLQGGYNEIWFKNLQGSFTYKLVVTYA
jgi:hypothetical protein